MQKRNQEHLYNVLQKGCTTYHQIYERVLWVIGLGIIQNLQLAHAAAAIVVVKRNNLL